MSRNAQTQDIDARYENHSVTNGDVAKYLEAENPNCPVSELSERYKTWKRNGKRGLDRIRANISCPECGSSDVFYTEEIRITRCDGCGLQIYETDSLNGGR